eukprot:Pgem_evm1s9067
MQLSLNTSQEDNIPNEESSLVSCIVHSSSKMGLRVRLEPSNVVQFIYASHLTDHAKLAPALLDVYSAPGTKLENLESRIMVLFVVLLILVVLFS